MCCKIARYRSIPGIDGIPGYREIQPGGDTSEILAREIPKIHARGGGLTLVVRAVFPSEFEATEYISNCNLNLRST